jgi:NodT family efflux transporter outer membrane factor (OMF) lipoprotein
MRILAFNYSLKLLPLSACLALSACAIDEPIKKADLLQKSLPGVMLPEKYKTERPSKESLDLRSNNNSMSVAWLTSFNDPELNELAILAMQSAPDLRVFAARRDQAEAMMKAVGGSFYPNVGIQAKTGSKMGVDGSGTSGFYIGANWEIDLWGRVRASYASAQQNALAVAADQESANLSYMANLAKTLWTARVLQIQASNAANSVTHQEKILEHIKQREKIGASSQQDISTAEINLSEAKDRSFNLQNASAQQLKTLDVLVGRYPVGTPLKSTQLPKLPLMITTGMPSDLLERRPDIKSAAARVDAARYNVKVAEATRLPTVSLTAGFGRVSSDIFVLKTDAANPSAGIGLTLPLFSGGALEQQVNAKQAELEQAFANYAKVGLNAFREVEAALSGEQSWHARYAELNQMYQMQQNIQKNTDAEFSIGRIDQRPVLQQKIKTHSAQSSQQQGQLEVLMQRINLYLSLGGPAT